MSLIAICGGGGKSTIFHKYPDFFIDIDNFVWSDSNKHYHNDIIDAIKRKDNKKLGVIYKKLLIKNKEILRNQNKIILAHHPSNAEWLEMDCLAILRPNELLHRENISKRTEEMKRISIDSWKNLEGAHEYNTHKELEELLLSIKASYFESS